MANELVVVPEIGELVMPTTKLNYIQEKKYRDWAMKTISEIEESSLAIETQKAQEYIKQNKAAYVEKVLSKHKDWVAVFKMFNTNAAEIRDLQTESRKQIDKLQRQIDELNEKKRSVLVANTEKGRVMWNAMCKKFEPLVDENEELQLDYFNEFCFDSNNNGLSFSMPHKFDGENTPRDVLLNPYQIDNALTKEFEKYETKVKQIKAFIKEVKYKLDEVMLFDDSKMHQLFQGIIDMRKNVKNMYTETFSKVVPDESD